MVDWIVERSWQQRRGNQEPIDDQDPLKGCQDEWFVDCNWKWDFDRWPRRLSSWVIYNVGLLWDFEHDCYYQGWSSGAQKMISRKIQNMATIIIWDTSRVSDYGIKIEILEFPAQKNTNQFLNWLGWLKKIFLP